MDRNTYMQQAIELATQGWSNDRVPVGCVLVYNNQVIAAAHNGQAPFEHAEYVVIKEAYGRIGEKIRESTLYVTLEPCAMCAAMIALCHIPTVIFGAYDTKNGGLEHNQRITIPNVIGGIMAEECGALLSQYFKQKR